MWFMSKKMPCRPEKGWKGICGQTENLKVARAALHFWEEPCISGDAGSGAVFFQGVRCIVYSVRMRISQTEWLEKKSLWSGSWIFSWITEKRANNINLVTPGHFVPQIVKALDQARKEGLMLPVVYNTSSYETVDTIKMLEGYVDIYLPDFKYRQVWVKVFPCSGLCRGCKGSDRRDGAADRKGCVCKWRWR